MTFEQAATILLDALALTIFDEAHSDYEERLFTLGASSQGRLLAVVHTYSHTGPNSAKARDIDVGQLVNQLLKKDIELIEVAR